METYDKWKIDILTERGVINDARREGLSEGIEKGIKKGKIEIVRNAKELGLSIEQIEKLTNFSVEEINAISRK